MSDTGGTFPNQVYYNPGLPSLKISPYSLFSGMFSFMHTFRPHV